MLSIVYCTRNANPSYTEELKKSSGIGKYIEVIEIINNGVSLTSCYNRGLKQAKNDIVVFLHDDLLFNKTENWGNKLLKHFEKSEYGIIGVAGSQHMPVSGIWYENKNKMLGQVYHTHEGKTWLSKYSESLGKDIVDVITVDGLFFAVDKTKIKKEFDESFNGFHYYDVSFCFENYLAGVKIGVITDIKINHKSIGMTNEEWEKNRIQFAEKYKDNLPVNIKRTFRKGEKLKVLIGCLSFQNLTGSELYNFELAKELVRMGCEVTICSNIGNPLATMAKQYGISVTSLQEPPNYKLGDGKWSLNQGKEQIPSQPNTLYKIADKKFDILHLSHKPVVEHLLRLYPDTDAVSTIHSEIINLEHPVISPQIKKYIAIRPEIKEYINTTFGIPNEQISVIYNPIDNTKFKPVTNKPKREKEIVLFVGTIDYLRMQAIHDLIQTTKDENKELWIVGKKNDTYLDEMIKDEKHVTYYPATSSIEKYVYDCDMVAGILLGRTTIEGWFCGKPAIIYDVNNMGYIESKRIESPPADLDKFKSEVVAKQIIEEYKNAIN